MLRMVQENACLGSMEVQNQLVEHIQDRGRLALRMNVPSIFRVDHYPCPCGRRVQYFKVPYSQLFLQMKIIFLEFYADLFLV